MKIEKIFICKTVKAIDDNTYYYRKQDLPSEQFVRISKSEYDKRSKTGFDKIIENEKLVSFKYRQTVTSKIITNSADKKLTKKEKLYGCGCFTIVAFGIIGLIFWLLS
jgi:hypothetical protein